MGRFLGGYSRYQKWGWVCIAFILMAWVSFDVGQLVARIDVLTGSKNIKGNITVVEAVEKSKTGSGRLIIVSKDAARFVDSSGSAWDIPDFTKSATVKTMDDLKKNGVLLDGSFDVQVRPIKTRPEDIVVSVLFDIAFKLLFVLLYVVIFYFIMRYVRGTYGRFKKITPEMPLAKIDDVAGYVGVKQELLEIVDYLKDPEKFERVGARPPKGVLLYGPPGNGKTLLAKAVAGEAAASFFEQSASSFIQIYAGEGAKAVRQLFDAARKAAPSVIFIDEIDAVGASRSIAGAHDERLQTVNAILTEMDGFANNTGIVVVAATNRLEVLDEALVRPGRFDRKVFIGTPSVLDREQILKRHSLKIQVADDVDWKHWSAQTKGFSGADLAAFVNEAAIEAARRNSEYVTNDDLVTARDRVLVGAKNVGQVLSDRERQIVSVHEMGHAFMRLHQGGRVEKVSIAPRGQSLGITVSVAEDDIFLHDREDLEKEIRILLGGKSAEIVVFGKATAGAADDLQKASNLARHICLQFGSEKWGTYMPHAPDQKDLETEAANLLNNLFEETKSILKEHQESLVRGSSKLQEKDELNEGEIIFFWEDKF